MSPLSIGPTNTGQSEEGKSTGLGTRDSEEIEMRMGPLVEHVRERERENGSYKWIPAWIGLGTGTAGEERERIVFTEALRDGYVLCQFMNKLRPGSVEWIDPHEDGMRRMSNVIKFLDSCFVYGLPPEDVFLHDDLINATPDSLTRVARTIIALVKLTEEPPPTYSLDESSSILPLLSGVTTGAGDDSPHMRSLGLSADGTITYTTGSPSISPPITSWSTTSSRRNQSASPSTMNPKGPPSMNNQSISHLSKNRSISPSTKNMSPSTDTSTSPLPNLSSLVSISPSPEGQNISSLHSERSIFSVASDRCAGPNDLAPWGPVIDGAGPQNVAVGGNMAVFVGACIGRGSWGSVYHSIDLNTRQVVAVKLVGLVGLKEDHITQIMHEIDLVKQLSHPSIIKYEGMARDEDTLRIVLEYVPHTTIFSLPFPSLPFLRLLPILTTDFPRGNTGRYAANESLKKKLESSGKLNETLVANYVVKILEGLDFLHLNGIVHGNLKAASIFTTDVGNVKLSDFGLSLNWLALWGEISNISCAPNWAAPEVIEHTGSSTKSDIWSLGCTVIELLTGHPPYGDIPNVMSVMSRMVMDDYPPIPEHFSRPLTPFLKRCFQKVPAHRPSVKELLEHVWLKRATSSIHDRAVFQI
ncbi:kinase-like domain-containing protein [Russula brevipes]|nr:kinase-like domain-containing protein [Russula brevipes]